MKYSILRKNMLYAVIVTLLSLLLSRFLIYDIFSASVFSSMEKSLDFEITDIYNAIAHKRALAKKSDAIVVVSIDGCSRQRIAQVIEAVDFFEPRVIGLDVLFNDTTDDDGLVRVIRSCPNLLLPAWINGDTLTGSYFYAEPKCEQLGIVNIEAGSVRDVVRHFQPRFRAGGQSFDSFAAALARIAAPEAFSQLTQRNRETETIRYSNTDFETLTAAEIVQETGALQPNIAEVLHDKIVLIGNIHDLSDEHLTPAKAMSGLHIHAYTLQTILDGSYIRQSPVWWNWSLALLLCWMIAFAGFCMKAHNLKGDSLYLRILQFVLICLLVFAGCLRFLHRGIYTDFAPALLMIGFSTFALDIWMGVIDLTGLLGRKLRAKNRIL